MRFDSLLTKEQITDLILIQLSLGIIELIMLIQIVNL